MTASKGLGPLGQISRSVRDISASKDWYERVLGLPHLFTFGKLSFFDCAGTRLYLQETETPTPESVLYFRVADIEAECRALTERGVEFKRAPEKIHTHEDGSSEWLAFFDDLEGRPLALICRTPPS